MVAIAPLPTPPELVAHLDTRIVGQSLAKKRVATAVYRHYFGQGLRDTPGGEDLGPQHVLLLGPTGVGKTLIAKVTARVLGVPTAFVAATSLVETGYVGAPVESMFAALLERAGGDAALAERGIVFLDEFDKLRRAPDVGRDVSGEGVQNGLLTLLDGRPVRLRYRDREVTLDSSRVLFLCTGAFAGLPAIVRRRLAHDREPLGFTGGARAKRRSSDAELLARATPEDLVEFGIIPELVGRFAGIVPLHELSHADLLRVLGEVKGSPLRAQERLFAAHGVRLVVRRGARSALVDRALAHGLGARALQRVVTEAFADLEFHLPRLAARGVGAVRMTRAAILGRSAPVLVPRHRLPDWQAPFPSAEQLRGIALGRSARAPAPPRAPRERTVRRPPAVAETLDLFSDTA